ncbi:MAG TPA: FAD-linked oxidase C-terminal domain-containing protein [Thermoanaerobaculia bacterium]|nr:FAD-linked oxidase C-terminal domain-containing protein [Thermoanaerobaculia bacterium]
MSREINRFPAVPFPHPDRPIREHVAHSDRLQKLNVDAVALAEALRRSIEGEVRFDDGARALYATDASNYRQVPIGVVVPKRIDDVIATVELARKFGAPILARGAGTSLAGQCCNVAVVLDFSKYLNEVVELDPARKFARVQPGIVLDDLRARAEQHRLTFGPDPATHASCTLGGMIGNNSCGVHALMAGKTVDNIDELDVLLYDGTRMRVGQPADSDAGPRGIYGRLRQIRDRYGDLVRAKFPKIPRRVSGYNLDELLPENGFNVARSIVGSEGTCAIVLEAKCRLVYSPPARALVVVGYPDIYVAADDVLRVLTFQPIGLEGFDDLLVRDMVQKNMHPEGLALLPPGGGWLLVEFGGESQGEADAKARRMMDALARDSRISTRLMENKRQERMIWAVRESGLGATAHVPGKPLMWEGWEDAGIPPEKLGGYLRDFRKLLGSYDYTGDFYGHFGQGCVHTRTNFDFESEKGVANFRAFLDDAADLVVSYGGSISGEHGDGQARGALLEKMFGPELIEAFREFKTTWDPDWKLNPGKLIDPYTPVENLRHGTGFHPWEPKTHFAYAEDNGRMAHAVMRCVSVGRCRRVDGGTMCPSYQVTREEEHSTRGRAHLLFEMFNGKDVPANWRNESVKDALDLCLACKGCKGDCPTGVDIATYKAEFLSHYYKGRLRPPAAYAMGLIYWWARAARIAPSIVNAFMRLGLTKKLAGVAPQRQMPQFAKRTFKEQFAKRGAAAVPAAGARGRASLHRVVLWPDTFNNNFTPATALAAAEVLERAGYEVIVPQQSLCCGRPLYDWGFLGAAKRLLRQTLTALGPYLEAGLPVVGLEPSCVSVFRDELTNLFPNDEMAKKLARSAMTLSEFIERERDFPLPSLARKALVQAHCHHKSIMRFDAEEALLRRMGLDVEHPDSGCCGMAGAFGFEQHNYDISMRVGERVILPAVREASEDTLIIANGFSCREQIEQGTGRHPLHLAEVLKMGFDR